MRLRTLSLAHARAVTLLPETFGKLTQLETLLLCGCERLEKLPDSFGQLRKLKLLDLTDCSELRTIPASLSGCEALETLRLLRCRAITHLPDLSGLTSLQAHDVPQGLTGWEAAGRKEYWMQRRRAFAGRAAK